jgi:hypothetical protein
MRRRAGALALIASGSLLADGTASAAAAPGANVTSTQLHALAGSAAAGDTQARPRERTV